jgi:hypothetical protein
VKSIVRKPDIHQILIVIEKTRDDVIEKSQEIIINEDIQKTVTETQKVEAVEEENDIRVHLHHPVQILQEEVVIEELQVQVVHHQKVQTIDERIQRKQQRNLDRQIQQIQNVSCVF